MVVRPACPRQRGSDLRIISSSRGSVSALVAGLGLLALALGVTMTGGRPQDARALAACQVHSNTAEELAFIELLQMYRNQHIQGSYPLVLSAPLNAAAAGYAQFLIDHPGSGDHYADGGTQGRAWADRAIQCGYPANIAAGGEGLAVVQGSGPVSVDPQSALNIMAAETYGGVNVPAIVGAPQVRCVGVAKVRAANGREDAWVVLLFGTYTTCPEPVTPPPPSTNASSTATKTSTPTSTPTKTPTPSPTPPPRTDGATINLTSGWNLVVIPPGDLDDVLYRAKGCFRSVYQQQGEHWVRYSPEVPAYARNLQTSNGGVFWVEGTAEGCGRIPL